MTWPSEKPSKRNPVGLEQEIVIIEHKTATVATENRENAAVDMVIAWICLSLTIYLHPVSPITFIYYTCFDFLTPARASYLRPKSPWLSAVTEHYDFCCYSSWCFWSMLQVSSLIFVIAGYRAFLESNSCLMIIVGFNLFRNSFSMISRVLKCFMEFYRNFIAYGITHSMSERRRMSGRRTFSAGQRPLAQPSFLYLLPRASEIKQILCFDWLCEKYWLLQGIKPPRLKIYLKHQSLGRRERVSDK